VVVRASTGIANGRASGVTDLLGHFSVLNSIYSPAFSTDKNEDVALRASRKYQLPLLAIGTPA